MPMKRIGFKKKKERKKRGNIGSQSVDTQACKCWQMREIMVTEYINVWMH